jgi:hypothetical protein
MVTRIKLAYEVKLIGGWINANVRQYSAVTTEWRHKRNALAEV